MPRPPETLAAVSTPIQQAPGEYPVSVLALAAFFVAIDFHLLRLETASRDGQRWAVFIFEDRGDGAIQRARQSYFHYNGQVDARTLSETYGQLNRRVAETLKEHDMDGQHAK